MKNIKTQNAIIKSLESILVVGYIIFEELIWNVLAKPLYQYFKNLIALEHIRNKFLAMNRYLLLGIFITILVITEALGVFSGLCIINGYIFSGILIYTLKIPIAAFTFWLFDLTKPKLLSFHYIKVSYEFVLRMIHTFVNSSIYLYIKIQIKSIRYRVRTIIKTLFGELGFRAAMKRYYSSIKIRVTNLVRSFNRILNIQ